MKTVFPEVLVTAGDPIRFFCGSDDTVTLDKEELTDRARSIDVKREYFRPEYFIGSDEFSEYRIGLILDAIQATEAVPNRLMNPMAFFYSILFWGKVGGSAEAGMLGAISGMTAGKSFLFLAVIISIVTACYTGRRRFGRKVSVSSPAVLIAATGFSSMSLEIIILFLLQNLYGYVYSMFGLITAIFMVSLTFGAGVGRKYAMRGMNGLRYSLVAAEMLSALTASVIIITGFMPFDKAFSLELAVVLLFGAMVMAGFATGLQFPPGLR